MADSSRRHRPQLHRRRLLHPRRRSRGDVPSSKLWPGKLLGKAAILFVGSKSTPSVTTVVKQRIIRQTKLFIVSWASRLSNSLSSLVLTFVIGDTQPETDTAQLGHNFYSVHSPLRRIDIRTHANSSHTRPGLKSLHFSSIQFHLSSPKDNHYLPRYLMNEQTIKIRKFNSLAAIKT